MATDYRRLVRAIGLVTGSSDVAEDCVQEALARAWERSERGEHIESLVAWVTTVSVNLSRSWLRRMRAERAARDRLRDSNQTEWSSDRVLDVGRALRALPRRQREAVILHYYLGIEVKEVARVLGVREGTVKSSLARSRRALAVSLGDREEENSNVGH